MRRPRTRGPLSGALDATLVQQPASGDEQLSRLAHAAVTDARDVLYDDDIQVSLTMIYELHYTGLDGVDDDWEWDPWLIGVRRILEDAFERRLRALVPADSPVDGSTPIAPRLTEVIEADDGPPMSKFLERTASVDHWREFLLHRGTYQLKEADPHAFGIPRIPGRAKVALAEIEADEYGSGRPERMHAALFAQTMRELGLDGTIGSTVDLVPAITLAHVEADAVHEQIAAHDLAGGLLEAEPQLEGDLLFGARVALALDALVSGHMLACWQENRSSLRPSLQEQAI